MIYLGIEIGGTKLQLGLGAGDGKLRRLKRLDVEPAAGGAGIRQQIESALPTLLSEVKLTTADLAGIGVGFGGPVDDAKRRVITSHQVEGWEDFPLAAWLQERSGLPVALGNDSDLAGLAEAVYGAGRGSSPLFYMNIGSGIGGALIIDGKVYRGSGRGAAEVGHLRGWRPGDPGQPHDWQTLEAVASGWSIERRARIVARNQADLYATAPCPTNLTVRQVAAAAQTGLDWAQQLLLETLSEVAEALCQVITLLAPRRIVMGGGVSLIGETYFLRPLRRIVAERVFKPFAGTYEIVAAELGEEVVVHGAIELARQQRQAEPT
jgi:glucokinase